MKATDCNCSKAASVLLSQEMQNAAATVGMAGINQALSMAGGEAANLLQVKCTISCDNSIKFRRSWVQFYSLPTRVVLSIERCKGLAFLLVNSLGMLNEVLIYLSLKTKNAQFIVSL